MNTDEFILPPNYIIRDTRSITDKWAVYKLLILEREEETSHFQLGVIILNPYTFILLTLIALILLLASFILTLNYWFKILSILLSIIVGYISLFQFSILYKLFIENVIIIIASYREQVIGSALMASKDNYSVLLGLYVAPSHRRRRVGTHIIEYLLQRDLLPIYLNAPPNLRGFYSRIGFIETNTHKGYNMVIRTLI